MFGKTQFYVALRYFGSIFISFPSLFPLLFKHTFNFSTSHYASPKCLKLSDSFQTLKKPHLTAIFRVVVVLYVIQSTCIAFKGASSLFIATFQVDIQIYSIVRDCISIFTYHILSSCSSSCTMWTQPRNFIRLLLITLRNSGFSF